MQELSRAEIVKDAVQELVESGASAAGQVASIVANAAGEIASVVGAFATDVFELRDGVQRAVRDTTD